MHNNQTQIKEVTLDMLFSTRFLALNVFQGIARPFRRQIAQSLASTRASRVNRQRGTIFRGIQLAVIGATVLGCGLLGWFSQPCWASETSLQTGETLGQKANAASHNKQVRVQIVSDVPRITIDGRAVRPWIFWGAPGTGTIALTS